MVCPETHNTRTISLPALPCLLLLTLLPLPALAQSSQGVLREVYSDIGGTSISALTSHPSFPNNPSLETIQPTFEAPTEFAENYGQRMRALLLPPQTGDYIFWIATDDNGALYLSTTDQPAQKTQIATVNAWTSSREWTKEANQRSAPIRLVAGQQYYIEALQKEGGGGDNLAVRWQLPSGAIEEPIPTQRLLVFGLGPPTITRQPLSLTLVEGATATFSIELARTLGASYQWLRNGSPIPGATNTSYSLSPVTLADTSTLFRCFVANNLGSTNSTQARLTVLADTTPPAISDVGNLGNNTIVFVLFSEPVEETSAANPGHYFINDGVTVLRAGFGADSRTVILTTSPMIPPSINSSSPPTPSSQQTASPSSPKPVSASPFPRRAKP